MKSFEPLTGVGFTLILIGYNRSSKKASLEGTLNAIESCLGIAADAETDFFADDKKEASSKRSSRKERRQGDVEMKQRAPDLGDVRALKFERLLIKD